MNRHGITTTKRTISFFSFRGEGAESVLDQVTLPPLMGMSNMRYHFGEWLKREGKSWEYAKDETICQWAMEFWNSGLRPHEAPRRFDRLATKHEARGGSEA